MRKFAFLSALFVAMLPAFGADLHFNNDGKFKIVQFTDTHVKYGNPMSDVAAQCVAEVLDIEKPDLVVFTGDIVYASPARKGLAFILNEAEKRQIPFVVTLGNHDDEQDMKRNEIYDYTRTYGHCIQPAGEDYVIEIGSHADSSKPASAIYCLDSHSYAPIEGVGKYGWHSFDQVMRYRQESERLTAANGGKPLPSLAFFHIPLPEYAYASQTDGNPLIGTRREKVTCPTVNTGIFTAMLEGGDIMGIFAGHDHNNDYTTLWFGILLGYGRYSGGNTVYNHLSNGARVIELHEGKREFDTWLRLRGGQAIDATSYPASYVRDEWKKRNEPLKPQNIVK